MCWNTISILQRKISLLCWPEWLCALQDVRFYLPVPFLQKKNRLQSNGFNELQVVFSVAKAVSDMRHLPACTVRWCERTSLYQKCVSGWHTSPAGTEYHYFRWLVHRSTLLASATMLYGSFLPNVAQAHLHHAKGGWAGLALHACCYVSGWSGGQLAYVAIFTDVQCLVDDKWLKIHDLA